MNEDNSNYALLKAPRNKRDKLASQCEKRGVGETRGWSICTYSVDIHYSAGTDQKTNRQNAPTTVKRNEKIKHSLLIALS